MVFTLAFLQAGSVFAAYVLDGRGIPALVAPALAASVCCLVSLYSSHPFELRVPRELKGAAPRLIQLLGLTFLLLGAGYALLPGEELSAPQLASVLVVGVGLVMPLRAVSHEIRTRRATGQRVLILGAGPLARKIVQELQGAPHQPYTVVGMVDGGQPSEPPPPGTFLPIPVQALDEMPRLVTELRPHRMVVALGERRGRLPVAMLLSSCARGVQVEDGVEFYERLTRKLAIESLSPSFLIFNGVLQKTRLQLALRRALSLAAAIVGLLLAAPLMALVAVLVKLESPGPALFIQERVGLRGRVFRLFKFRTMQGEPPHDPDVWRRDDEPRLTRLGAFLRDMHLDELPQFFNVLKGDMDMVGPRPEMACNVQSMTEHIPYYGLRHIVRPGMTGWAQIKQGYAVSQAEVTEKMRYDLYYIKHMSLWLDLRILVRTARIVLFGRGRV